MDRRLQLHSWAHLRERLGGRAVLRDDEVLFVLLGRLAKSEGRVVDGHIQQARQEMQRLEMSEPARLRAIAAFNRGKSGSERLHPHLRRLKQQPHAAEGLLRACWRMVWADGRVGRHERELLMQWGQQLGWSTTRVQALASDYEPHRAALGNQGISYPEALRLLGCYPRPSLYRSSRPTGACSAGIIRTNWWVAARARRRCATPPSVPVTCIRPTRWYASGAASSRPLAGSASRECGGTVAPARQPGCRAWPSGRPGGSCCP